MDKQNTSTFAMESSTTAAVVCSSTKGVVRFEVNPNTETSFSNKFPSFEVFCIQDHSGSNNFFMFARKSSYGFDGLSILWNDEHFWSTTHAKMEQTFEETWTQSQIEQTIEVCREQSDDVEQSEMENTTSKRHSDTKETTQTMIGLLSCIDRSFGFVE